MSSEFEQRVRDGGNEDLEVVISSISLVEQFAKCDVQADRYGRGGAHGGSHAGVGEVLPRAGPSGQAAGAATAQRGTGAHLSAARLPSREFWRYLQAALGSHHCGAESGEEGA